MSEAQGLPVAGYKPTQPQWAIDAVNELKLLEERALRVLEANVGVDPRFASIAKTQLQIAFMCAARSIFQPQRITLPEDKG